MIYSTVRTRFSISSGHQAMDVNGWVEKINIASEHNEGSYFIS